MINEGYLLGLTCYEHFKKKECNPNTKRILSIGTVSFDVLSGSVLIIVASIFYYHRNLTSLSSLHIQLLAGLGMIQFGFGVTEAIMLMIQAHSR